jgi:uncharacterized membrane protein
MKKPSSVTDLLFRIGMTFKGIDSVFEVIGGIILTMPTRLARYILAVSQHESFRHHQVLAGRLGKIADTVTTHPSMLEAGYLMVHGLSKLILIIAIVCGKRWGFLGFIVVLSLFTLIELVRAVTAREVVTGVFGAFDLLIVFLIYREYKTRFAAKPQD